MFSWFCYEKMLVEMVKRFNSIHPDGATSPQKVLKDLETQSGLAGKDLILTFDLIKKSFLIYTFDCPDFQKYAHDNTLYTVGVWYKDFN